MNSLTKLNTTKSETPDCHSELRVCKVCQVARPLTEFHRKYKHDERLRWECHSCGRAQRKRAALTKPLVYWVLGVWLNARKRAAKKGLPFTLTREWLLQQLPTHCPVFGIELDYAPGRGRHASSPSVDRVRPDLGYVPGNVAIISDRANTVKSVGTAEEHRLIADWMDKLNEYAH